MENGGIRAGSDVAGVGAKSRVSIVPNPFAVSVSREMPVVLPTPMTTASSECLADGSLQLRFPEYQGGGEATLSDSSMTLVYLYRATGDELLVRRVGRSRGWQFPAVPYDVSNEVWFRFRRVAPLAE